MAFKWVSNNNTRHVFMVISTVQVLVCLLSVPMCKLHLFPPSHQPPNVQRRRVEANPLL